MGLLDTYIKLQSIKQQEQRAQLDQVHSILYLADAARKMKDMQTEDNVSSAIAGVSPYNTVERPTGSIVGGNEGYDVADPETMMTSQTPKGDEQYYADIFEATKGISPKSALPFLTAKRGAVKERETEERRRAENPIVPIQFGGREINASLSNVAPIVGREESLDQRKLESDRQEQYRQDKLTEDKRHRQTIEAIRTSGGALPKPPKDYRYTTDGELEPIPGGKEDAKRRESHAKADKMVKGTVINLTALKKQAEKLIKHPGLRGITGISGAIFNIPGGKAANAEALLTQLKSRTSLDTLQNMRAISPTGGALGNVSDAEGKRLETYIAALDKAQDTKTMKEALTEIINYVDSATGNLQSGFEQTFSDRDKERYGGRKSAQVGQTQTTTKTVVERRKSADGKRILVKYSDGTIGEE